MPWHLNQLTESVAQSAIGSVQLAGVTMFDGGKIVEGAVSQLSQESIKKFEEEFLKI
jgi:hypothetical protein